MPYETKQKIGLELTRSSKKHDRKLRYGRVTKDGEIGWAKDDWTIGETSNLPRPVFFELLNRLSKRYKKLPKDDRGFNRQKPEIQLALRRAAVACGCDSQQSKNGRFVYWKLSGKSLLKFAIVDFEKYPDRHYNGKKGRAILADKVRSKRRYIRKMEKESKAVFRVAIVVLQNTPPTILPFSTRKD